METTLKTTENCTEYTAIAEVVEPWAPSGDDWTLEVVEMDPPEGMESGVYALKIRTADGEDFDHLFIQGLAGGLVGSEPLDALHVQEVTYRAWPPKSLDDVDFSR